MLSCVRGCGVDVIIPICGMRPCVSEYVRSLLSRDLGRIRVVLISSTSPSGYPVLYSRCTSRCRGIFIVRGRGTNLKCTEGDNVSITQKRCVYFVSSSSFVRPSVLRGLCGRYVDRGLSIVCSRFGISGCPRCGIILRPTHLCRKHRRVRRLRLSVVNTRPRCGSGMGFRPSTYGKLCSVQVVHRRGVCFLSRQRCVSRSLLFGLSVLRGSSQMGVIP